MGSADSKEDIAVNGAEQAVKEVEQVGRGEKAEERIGTNEDQAERDRTGLRREATRRGAVISVQR